MVLKIFVTCIMAVSLAVVTIASIAPQPPVYRQIIILAFWWVTGFVMSAMWLAAP